MGLSAYTWELSIKVPITLPSGSSIASPWAYYEIINFLEMKKKKSKFDYLIDSTEILEKSFRSN